MAKAIATYLCTACNHTSDKWLGNCPHCGKWNTFVEATASKLTIKGGANQRQRQPRLQPLKDISVDTVQIIPTDNQEFNRVLGGGIIPGMTMLIGGEPGIGKSTLLLQLAAYFGEHALFVSSEESDVQIKRRAMRLTIDTAQFKILCTSDLITIINTINTTKPQFLIIDSIQMIRSPDSDASLGGISQLKQCCQELIDCAHGFNITLFLVAHVTKEGAIAGPKLIEHLVDAVLYFEDEHDNTRFLRVTKNRHGTVNEIGIFEMQEQGLISVKNTDALFVSHRNKQRPIGVAIATIVEGSRCFVVEIQALTIKAGSGISRVYSDRIDPRTVSRVAAVLEKHCNIPLGDYDVYINVAGGMYIKDVGVELALAHAIYSARTERTVPYKLCSIGELSLAGEIRMVKQMERRLAAAHELGYSDCVGPATIISKEHDSAQWVQCLTIQQSIKAIHQQ